jgi:hypothetical protein
MPHRRLVLCRWSLAYAALPCWVPRASSPTLLRAAGRLLLTRTTRCRTRAALAAPGRPPSPPVRRTSMLEVTVHAQSSHPRHRSGNVEDHVNEVVGITMLRGRGSTGVITYELSSSQRCIVEVIHGKGATAWWRNLCAVDETLAPSTKKSVQHGGGEDDWMVGLETLATSFI